MSNAGGRRSLAAGGPSFSGGSEQVTVSGRRHLTLAEDRNASAGLQEPRRVTEDAAGSSTGDGDIAAAAV